MTKQWDLSLLDNFFLPHEVSSIKSIPLCKNRVADKIFWPLNPSGVYTVKSGYQFLVEEQKYTNAEVLQPSQAVVLPIGQAKWQKIWSLSIPNKVRNFVWRDCKNSILVKTNLVKRKVLIEDSCDHCHLSCEDTLHALWNCPLLSPIWDSYSMWTFRHNSEFNSFGELIKFIIEEGKNLELFAVIVWTIWSRRNLLRISDKPFPISQVLPNAIATHANFIHTLPNALPTLNSHGSSTVV
nr:putative ribonuclease h protein [Quercus suber]